MDDPYELALAMFILAFCGLLLVVGELYLVTKEVPPAPTETHSPQPGAVSSVPSFQGDT